MNFLKYSTEIRNRLLLLVLSWVLSITVCYYYKEIIFFFILNLINSIDTIYEINFIFTNITEVFYVYLKLIFFISNQIFLFSLLYHIFIFFSLGLYRSEYENLKFFSRFFMVLFFLSLLILNFILMPLSWSFFLKFQNQDLQLVPFYFEAKLDEYLTYYISLYYLVLANTQISLFLFVLINYYSRDVTTIQNLRKLFYFLFFVISTLTTPPDVISQLVFSFILICVYEIIIFLNINKATS